MVDFNRSSLEYRELIWFDWILIKLSIREFLFSILSRTIYNPLFLFFVFFFFVFASSKIYLWELDRYKVLNKKRRENSERGTEALIVWKGDKID